ncbi:F0F1 ATP synthase subunit B [Candidatus Microgenomates bacterium]|nr:F0F1 ATP synthase subunit B [Candidatus Microgenomates bacterium]
MEKLGIEPILLIAQIINFGIIAFLLTKFLYRPLFKMIEDRKRKIDEGLKLAVEMKDKEEEITQEKERVLEKARAEGQKLINEAKEQAKAKEGQILLEAAEEAKGIKEKAKLDAETEKKKMMDDAKKQILALSLAIAKAAVDESLADDKSQIALISQKVEKFAKEKINA